MTSSELLLRCDAKAQTSNHVFALQRLSGGQLDLSILRKLYDAISCLMLPVEAVGVVNHFYIATFQEFLPSS